MRCGLAVFDLWVHLEQSLAVLVCEQQDGLGGMPNPVSCQARLVIVDERDDVSARNVAVIDDSESAAIEIEFDAHHLSRRDARADSPSVQKTWKDEVVYITCCAGCLCNPLFAQDVSPDGLDATHSEDDRRKRSMSTAGASTRRATSILSSSKIDRAGTVVWGAKPDRAAFSGKALACCMHDESMI